MTVREKLEAVLVNHGLWPEEATAVFDRMLDQRGDDLGMSEVKWNDPKEAYPTQLYAVILASLQQVAVEWIDEHKPKHFARAALV